MWSVSMAATSNEELSYKLEIKTGSHLKSKVLANIKQMMLSHIHIQEASCFGLPASQPKRGLLVLTVINGLANEEPGLSCTRGVSPWANKRRQTTLIKPVTS